MFRVWDWRAEMGIDAEPSYQLYTDNVMMAMQKILPPYEVPEYEAFDCGDVAAESYAIRVGEYRFCYTRWKNLDDDA
jgi:hypothetical protein